MKPLKLTMQAFGSYVKPVSDHGGHRSRKNDDF